MKTEHNIKEFINTTFSIEINNYKEKMEEILNQQTNSLKLELNMIKNDLKNIKIKSTSPEFNINKAEQVDTLDNKTEISNIIDNRNLTELTKLLPPISDWPKFTGEGEYDHISFIKYLDHILEAYGLPEQVLMIRLPRLFEGVALDWFVTKRETTGIQNWTYWKESIKVQFGTRIWKKKLLKLFETDFFDSLKDKPHQWCLNQKKRLDCTYTNLSKEEINERILGQCNGTL